MKKKKMFAQAVAVLSATALSASPVLAAGWQKDATGWWWQENKGGYPANNGSGWTVTMTVPQKAIILAAMAICMPMRKLRMAIR